MADCITFLRTSLSREAPREVLDYICSVNWLYSIALADKKSRYQLAAVTDHNGRGVNGSHIASIEFIRGASGHSGSIAANMDENSAYVTIDSRFAEDILPVS